MSRFNTQRKSLMFALILSTQFLFSQHYQDCDQAFPVCNKQTYHFKSMQGYGTKRDALGPLRCFQELMETNALWLTWDVAQSGILTFFIDPAVQADDIDFVLFRSSKDCTALEEVRCMAAGTNVGEPEVRSAGCKGQTGLSYQSIDDFEHTGCKYESDNFLKFLSAEQGEKYFLLVNNYNSSEGFSITFDGDTEFRTTGDCGQFNVEQPIEISSIVPNPASKNISVNFLSLKDQQIQTEIFSINGKRLYKGNMKTDKGMNKHVIDVENYTPGTYLIRLTQDKYSTIRQFIKI
jgi:hypothetical protein